MVMLYEDGGSASRADLSHTKCQRPCARSSLRPRTPISLLIHGYRALLDMLSNFRRAFSVSGPFADDICVLTIHTNTRPTGRQNETWIGTQFRKNLQYRSVGNATPSWHKRFVWSLERMVELRPGRWRVLSSQSQMA